MNEHKRSYEIDIFRPDDAAGVGQLFREVYGDGYPVKIVYEPEQLVRAFQKKDYIPVVARAPDNRVLGFTSLYRSAPHGGLYEVGLSLVLPDWRNTPIAGLLFRHSIKTAQTFPGVDAIFAENVCNHTYTQKAAVIFKAIETAIEVDLMPAAAYEREQTASGRVSTVDTFRTFVPKPHVVYVPGIYEDFYRYVYGGFDDGRTLRISADTFPSGGKTAMSTQIFDFAQVARVTVLEAGADFPAVFEAQEKRIIEHRHCAVIQAWLKSSCPWTGAVADMLRARGFFLGGILPRWFGEDGLLMQKLLARPNWESINLYTDRAAQILQYIRDDWEKIVKPGWY